MKNKTLTKIVGFFKKDKEFEHCVICGAPTYIPISMPIDLRENYIVGLGQICDECAEENREKRIRENSLTASQGLQTTKQCKK